MAQPSKDTVTSSNLTRDRPDSDHESCSLVQCVLEEDFSRLQNFLQEGIDVNHQDEEGNTALMMAVQNDKAQFVETLLKAKASAETKNRQGLTALSLAITLNKPQIARQLTDAGVTVTADDLCKACSQGLLEMCEILTPKCTDLNGVDCGEKTPLARATEKGHADIVLLLLKSDADVNKTMPLIHVTDEENIAETIHWQASYQSFLKNLRFKGSSVVSLYGNTALNIAAVCNQTEIVRLLLNHGADINHLNSYNCTPTIQAAQGSSVETLKVLIQRGAVLNCQDEAGMTALMWAGKCSNTKCFKLLLENGADTRLKNRVGQTALSWALAMNTCYKSPSELMANKEIIQAMLGKGVELGRDFHLLILEKIDWLDFQHFTRNNNILPSLEYIEGKTGYILSREFSYLDGQALTPFVCAMIAGKYSLARFFISNWFLHSHDLTLRPFTDSSYKFPQPSIDFLQSLFRKPWTLKSLSFVHVSTSLGFGSSREERVRSLSLDSMMESWLLFKTKEWNCENWAQLTFSSVHMNLDARNGHPDL